MAADAQPATPSTLAKDDLFAVGPVRIPGAYNIGRLSGSLPRKGEHNSEEVRKKISQAMKGKKLSEEHRIRFAEGTRKYVADFIRVHGRHPSKGRHPKTEFKKGNTLWVGRHHTEESKKKLSLALTGKRQSAETRKKKSIAHIGKVPWNKGVTKETSPALARVGEATRRRWTEEMRQKLRERNTKFWKEYYSKHPEAKARLTQVSRPTSIELLPGRPLSEGAFQW